jgi:sodium transport system permease protein
MSRLLRIWSIYRKELLNITRDRRAMLAMIIIPVVLYPALMLGFVRAMESDELRLRSQTFLVETDSEDVAAQLGGIVDFVSQQGGKEQATFLIKPGNTPPAMLGDDVQLRVSLEDAPRPAPFPDHLTARISYNEINARSRTAMEQLSMVLGRFRELMTRMALEKILGERPLGVPTTEPAIDLVLEPVSIQTVSSATDQQRGGFALGLVVPVILVLMTITGAIYPAIDVTAGERERGTLEALLATPVPVLHMVTAKFLVVATVGLLAALVNVLSVGATMHFGGLTRVFAHSDVPIRFPASTLPIIVFSMIPFAMLSSAILVAVCSFARSYKEAQTYVTPVIILALVPAVAATLPSIQLKGILLVVPVGNMVLLTRELFQQTCTWSQVAIVLLSTTLYAAAAIGVAAKLFGQEAVLFADAGSYKTLIHRRLFRRVPSPSASQVLLLTALLFPAAFYVSGSLSDVLETRFVRGVAWLAVVQFGAMFVLVPLGLAVYLKADVFNTFRLRLPSARAWAAAVLVGLSSWAVAIEFAACQTRVVPPSEALERFDRMVAPQIAQTPLWIVVCLIAVVPALSEEFLFRGFLLSGLCRSTGKWTAILAAGLIFGVFHFMADRIPVTALMGVVLGYMCWQTRSLLPGILVHVMHNALPIVLSHFETVSRWLGLSAAEAAGSHLPPRVALPAVCLLAGGLILLAAIRQHSPAAGGAEPPSIS